MGTGLSSYFHTQSTWASAFTLFAGSQEPTLTTGLLSGHTQEAPERACRTPDPSCPCSHSRKGRPWLLGEAAELPHLPSHRETPGKAEVSSLRDEPLLRGHLPRVQ